MTKIWPFLCIMMPILYLILIGHLEQKLVDTTHLNKIVGICFMLSSIGAVYITLEYFSWVKCK